MQSNAFQDSRTVVIIHSDILENAGPDEQDTLATALYVKNALDQAGFKGLCLPYRSKELQKRLDDIDPYCIFNMVESIEGSGTDIWRAADNFSDTGYAFTGNSPEAIRVTTDKLETKYRLINLGLPTPFYLNEEDIATVQKLDRRYIVKALDDDASLGLFADSITGDAEVLRNIVADRKKRYKGRWFAEEFIDGRECHVSMMQTENEVVIFPVSELDFSLFAVEMPHISCYRAKWEEESAEFKSIERKFVDPEYELDLVHELKHIAGQCWNGLGLKGWARIDFRIGPDRMPTILEINTNPSLWHDASFPVTAARAGYSYVEMIRTLVESAVNMHVNR
jgi:D-alanine-D-alanine ligase